VADADCISSLIHSSIWCIPLGFVLGKSFFPVFHEFETNSARDREARVVWLHGVGGRVELLALVRLVSIAGHWGWVVARVSPEPILVPDRVSFQVVR
jgi:hypothetical protein